MAEECEREGLLDDNGGFRRTCVVFLDGSSDGMESVAEGLDGVSLDGGGGFMRGVVATCFVPLAH